MGWEASGYRHSGSWRVLGWIIYTPLVEVGTGNHIYTSTFLFSLEFKAVGFWLSMVHMNTAFLKATLAPVDRSIYIRRTELWTNPVLKLLYTFVEPLLVHLGLNSSTLVHS